MTEKILNMQSTIEMTDIQESSIPLGPTAIFSLSLDTVIANSGAIVCSSLEDRSFVRSSLIDKTKEADSLQQTKLEVN